MTVTTLATRDLAPRIATEIRADKQDLLSGVHAGTLRELLERRGVLVFPQIHFTDEEQVAFTETLGTLATERRGEQVYNVTLDTAVNKQADYLKGSLYWHIDGTMNEVPIFASLLSSKVLPRTGGGDTEFCNTYAAYEDLSEEDKHQLESLRVMHSTWNTLLYYDPEPDIATLRQMMAIGERELPLVWTHRSGRKSLILGCTASHIVGMEPQDEHRNACASACLGDPSEIRVSPQVVCRRPGHVGQHRHHASCAALRSRLRADVDPDQTRR